MIGWPELMQYGPYVCLGALALVLALLFLIIRRR